MAIIIAASVVAILLAIAALENILFPSGFDGIAVPFYVIAGIGLFFAIRQAIVIRKRYAGGQWPGAHKSMRIMGLLALIVAAFGAQFILSSLTADSNLAVRLVSAALVLALGGGGFACLMAPPR
jgi:hypothetical protein